MRSQEDASLWGTPPPTNNQSPAFGPLAPPPRRAAGPARAKTAEMLARLTAWQQQASSTSESEEQEDAPAPTSDGMLSTATLTSDEESRTSTSYNETELSTVTSAREEEAGSSFDSSKDSKDSDKADAAKDGHSPRSPSSSRSRRGHRRGSSTAAAVTGNSMVKTFSSVEAAAAELEAVCWRGGGFPMVRNTSTKCTVTCLRNPGRCKWKAVARCRPRGSNDEGQPLSPLWWIMESDVNRKHSHRRNERSQEQSQRAGSATSLSSFEMTSSQEHTSKATSPAASTSDLVSKQVEGTQKSPAPASLAPQASLQPTAAQAGPSTPIRRNVAAPPISWLRSSGQKPPPDYRPNIQHRPSEPSPPFPAKGDRRAPSFRTPSIARPRSPQLQASLDEVARRVRSHDMQGTSRLPRRDVRPSIVSSPSAQAAPSASRPQTTSPQPYPRSNTAPCHAESSAAHLQASSRPALRGASEELHCRALAWRTAQGRRRQRYEPYSSSIERVTQESTSYFSANQRHSGNVYDSVRRARFSNTEAHLHGSNHQRSG